MAYPPRIACLIIGCSDACYCLLARYYGADLLIIGDRSTTHPFGKHIYWLPFNFFPPNYREFKGVCRKIGAVQQLTLDAVQQRAYLKAIEMTGPKAGPHPEDPDMANTKSTASTAKKATEAAETFTADTQKLVSEQIEKITKGFEDASDFGQKNLDALVKSSEIAAKAVEGINSEITAFSKKAFDESVAAAQDLAAAKNVTELLEKQTAFAKSFFEGYVAQTSKLNEICAAATKDIVEPVNARVTAATEAAKSFTA